MTIKFLLFWRSNYIFLFFYIWNMLLIMTWNHPKYSFHNCSLVYATISIQNYSFFFRNPSDFVLFQNMFISTQQQNVSASKHKERPPNLHKLYAYNEKEFMKYWTWTYVRQIILLYINENISIIYITQLSLFQFAVFYWYEKL